MKYDPETVAEVLSYLTQFNMQHLEYLSGLKSTPKSEIRRHEKIIQVGLRACEIFKVPAAEGHNRVKIALELREGEAPPNDVKTFYTLEEATCYMLECTMATLEGTKIVTRTPKRVIQKLEEAISTSLNVLATLNLIDARQGQRNPLHARRVSLHLGDEVNQKEVQSLLDAVADFGMQRLEAYKLLEQIFAEIGPYRQGTISDETWAKVQKLFKFDDLE